MVLLLDKDGLSLSPPVNPSLMILTSPPAALLPPCVTAWRSPRSRADADGKGGWSCPPLTPSSPHAQFAVPSLLPVPPSHRLTNADAMILSLMPLLLD